VWEVLRQQLHDREAVVQATLGQRRKAVAQLGERPRREMTGAFTGWVGWALGWANSEQEMKKEIESLLGCQDECGRIEMGRERKNRNRFSNFDS
jgi:hypothetical protein